MVDQQQSAELSSRVMRKLEGIRSVTDEQVRQAAQEILNDMLGGQYLSVQERRQLISGVLNQMKKLGPLQPLLDDPSITEIMINGPDCVFIEQNGRVTRSPQHFESKKQLEDIIQKIVSRVNRTVDTSNPICDARLLARGALHRVHYRG